jgi:beta-N-acetylhexosaminidase
LKNISRFPPLQRAIAAITTDARVRKILFPAKRINFNVDVMKHTSVGQLLLVGVQGLELGADEAKLLRRVQPGGFILFGRNIKTPGQLRKLVDDLRNLSLIEPIITIDQEGGRVSRLRLIGNEPPSAQQLRDKGDIELIREHGDSTGDLLRLFGFNLDLCPVLDISFDDDADNSLRGRCYGKTVKQVIGNAAAFNNALRAAGVASCGKHFPGYSAAVVDAHHSLPKIDRTRAELDANELAVFRAFAGRGGSPEPPASRGSHVVDSMMICHGWYPCFEEKKTPASLSHRVVTQLLRDELGFDGLVMTDDLDMGAIVNEYSFDEMLRLTFAAGNDLAMICHRIDKAEEALGVIEKLPRKQISCALASVAAFKSKMQPPTKFSESAFRKLDDVVWKLRVAVLGEERAAERSPENAARSPVERY